MIYFTIIITILIFFNIFVFFFKKKIQKLEQKIIKLFKKRSCQIVSIFVVSKKYVSRHEDIFKDFLELKRKDFSENLFITSLDDKIIIYKQLHNEINFIFKICDKNQKLVKNAVYNYTKDSIMEKSGEIGEKYDIYNKISSKYKKLAFFSRLSIIGIFMGN